MGKETSTIPIFVTRKEEGIKKTIKECIIEFSF